LGGEETLPPFFKSTRHGETSRSFSPERLLTLEDLMIVRAALIIAFLSFLTHSSDTFAETKYNPYSGTWELANPDEELQYNPYEGKWSYAPEDSSPQYNPFENQWELGTDRSELEYNPFESTWERAEPGEELEWNPWTGKWGYAKE
jgi:hypothetical protein